MQKLVIEGGYPLSGEVSIAGSKNASLPILAASLLTEDEIELENVSNLNDIHTMLKLLAHLGVESSWDKSIRLRAKNITSTEAPYDFVKTMRGSIEILGPLLARTGEAKISLPGGCAIGARPVDLHIKALEKLGAQISIEHGFIIARAKKLIGNHIFFDRQTVAGTMNAMMAAVLAEGQTLLKHCAKEPEIPDLANCLISMGAEIEGAGTDTITITGVKKLSGTKYRVIPDRIECGTFMVAAALCGEKVVIKNFREPHVEPIIEKLRETGTPIKIGATDATISKNQEIKPINIITMPHPGFPTDMQAQFTSLLSLANGISTINETIFENRFMHVDELNRMGAHISIESGRAIITGVKKLSGAITTATDLRASASLIIAALAAEGTSEVHNIYHLDRGYERIEEKLEALGAKIRRVDM